VTPSKEQPISLNEIGHEARIEYFHERYRGIIHKLRTSTSDEVAKMLAVVAATIGCEIPPMAVLAKYIDLLGRYSPDLLDYAGDQVLRNHKWNNFPKVAEFIGYIKDEHNDFWHHHAALVGSMNAWGINPPTVPTMAMSQRRGGMKQIGVNLPEIKRGNDG